MPEIFGAALMGGGSGPAYAAISVTYPDGATCTCALGSKTFTAPDTSGQALFIVPTAGEWTVSISQSGQEPKSQTVNVNESKAYVIELIFGLYLYKDGDKLDGVGGTWAVKNEYQGGGIVSTQYEDDRAILSFRGKDGSYTSAGFWYKNYDLTDFKKLVAVVDTSKQLAGLTFIGLVVSNSITGTPLTSPVASVLFQKDSGINTYELDVSNITGDKYLGIGSRSALNDGIAYPMDVFQIYLEA